MTLRRRTRPKDIIILAIVLVAVLLGLRVVTVGRTVTFLWLLTHQDTIS
jgi:hypothetical protein